MAKPKPIALVKERNGPYRKWRGRANPHLFHAVVFEDGNVFDAVNGWWQLGIEDKQLVLDSVKADKDD